MADYISTNLGIALLLVSLEFTFRSLDPDRASIKGPCVVAVWPSPTPRKSEGQASTSNFTIPDTKHFVATQSVYELVPF